MPQEPTPPPLPAKSGRFKTVVAWVCGPIVLVELIVLVALMIWAAFVALDANSSKTYVTTARFLVGGAEINQKLENGEPIPDSFYATNAEIIMSREVQSRAHARVHAMHPDLTPHAVKIEAKRLSGTRILVLIARSDDEETTQRMLNAVMEEFLAMRKEVRGWERDRRTGPMRDAIVKLEKAMFLAEQEIKDAGQGGASPEQLTELKAALQQKKMALEKQEAMLRSLESAHVDGEVITILERATPAALVIPRLSIFNLRK